MRIAAKVRRAGKKMGVTMSHRFGPPMATNIEANLQSVALIFSAIESSRTGQPVKVQEFLQAARDREGMA